MEVSPDRPAAEDEQALALDQSPAAGRAGDLIRRGQGLFGRAYRGADDFLDRGQSRAFRLLWFFLPEPSIVGELRFQALLVSRFLSDAGQQALAYGALIAIVRGGGSAFDAALLGVSALIPPTLLGLYGG